MCPRGCPGFRNILSNPQNAAIEVVQAVFMLPDERDTSMGGDLMCPAGSQCALLAHNVPCWLTTGLGTLDIA